MTAQLLREVATKTNDVAGDGTTTATPQIAELDADPFIVSADGTSIVDARVQVTSTASWIPGAP